MNIYNFDIDFTNGKIYGPNFLLVVNDHNSTTFNFTFDQKGRYVFKLLYPDNTIYVQDIIDGKIVLTKGVLNQEGNYKFEVCLYGDDNRLTTARIKEFPVRHELVETDEPIKADDRLPILDNLIEETNKVVEDAKNGKFDGATFTPSVSEDGDLSWSNDQGKENPPTVNIKGPAGEPGAVKMQVVDSLPDVGRTDTIYLVKKEHPTEQNLYEEYVYTETSGWEHIGDTSVDLTDYYTKQETDEKLEATKYTLPIASADTLGGIKIGDGLSVDEDGLVSASGQKLPLTFLSYGFFSNRSITDTNFISEVEKLITSNLNKITINRLAAYTDSSYPYAYMTYCCTSGIYTSRNTYTFYGDSTAIGTYYEEPLAETSTITVTGNWADNQYHITSCSVAIVQGLKLTTPSMVLTKTNSNVYTPSTPYNPATKKYVDDCIAALPSSDATKTLENQRIFFKRFDKETYPGVDDLFIGGTNDSGICEYFSSVLNKMAEDVDSLYDAQGLLLLVLPQMSIMLTFGGLRFRGVIVNTGNMLTQYDLNLSYEENNGQYTVSLVAMGQSTPNVDTPYYESSITPKSYVDTVHYTQMTGYDESKTQILKNINGTLTWVDET